MSLSKLYKIRLRNLREIDLRSQSRKIHILYYIYVRKIRGKESTGKGLFIFMYRRALTLFTWYTPKRKEIEGKKRKYVLTQR